MAYLKPEDDTYQSMPGARPPAQGPIPSGGGAPAPTAGGGGGGGGGGRPPGQGGGGTGYQNLQTLLGANQFQAQDMASSLGGDIDKSAQGVQSGLSGLQGQYAAAGDQGQLTGQRNSLSSFSPGAYGALQGQAQQTQQNAGLTGSQAGLQTLAQQKYGQGQSGYSQGQAGMDAFLMGQAGGSKLAGMGGKYGQLTNMLGGADEASQRGPQLAAQYSAPRGGEGPGGPGGTMLPPVDPTTQPDPTRDPNRRNARNNGPSNTHTERGRGPYGLGGG